MDGMLARNAGRVGPGRLCFGSPTADDLEEQSIRISKGDHLFRVRALAAAHGTLVGNPMPNETLDPEADRARQHRERGHRDLSCADTSATRAGPGEERHDAPRGADLVAVVEVIGLRIVEVDRALDESEAKEAGVEVDVALR